MVIVDDVLGDLTTDLASAATTAVAKSAFSMKMFNDAMNDLVGKGRVTFIDTPKPSNMFSALNWNPIRDTSTKDRTVIDNLLFSITKAEQLSPLLLNEAEKTMHFNGGMVTTKQDDGKFRKLPITPRNLSLRNFYDGKRQGVIAVFSPSTSLDGIANKLGQPIEWVEIPLRQLPDFFDWQEVDKLINGMLSSAPTEKVSLYSQAQVASLSDFGIF
jgi:hypothetical protein